MSVDFFRWLLAGVMILELAAGVVLSNGAGGIGVSAEWANEAYRFAAGSSVWGLCIAVSNALLYWALMKATVVSEGTPLTGIFRRWVAFWIDFIWVIFSLSPVVGLLPVLLEAKRTGHFAWSFARDAAAGSDVAVAIFAGLVTLAVLWFYFAIPLYCSRPSPGACLLGYRVVCDEAKSLTMFKAAQRSLLGFVGVCAAPLAPFVDGSGLLRTWLDERFGLRAVNLKK